MEQTTQDWGNSKQTETVAEVPSSEKSLTNTPSKQSNQWGSYFQSARSFVRMPENQFDHAWQLLSTRGRSIDDFPDLQDPSAFLGFIGSDNLLRFYQNDTIYIENLFSMAKKSEPIREVFNVLFHAWLFEIRLTANKDGIERRLQHSFGGGVTAEAMGKMMQDLEKKRQQDAYANQQNQQGAMYQ